MSTQHAVSMQVGTADEELKAERVQEPVATFRTQLKAERVQEELAAAGAEMEAKPAFTLELAVYQPQTVIFELFASKLAITLHGIASVGDSGIAG